MRIAISQTFRAVFMVAAIAIALATNVCAQTETVLYSFSGGSDGSRPDGLTFDTKGNLYGVTAVGGEFGGGTVFLLSPAASGWTETVVYTFQGGTDGEYPQGNLIFDASGNIYGTTSAGGLQGYCYSNSCGTVYQLSPTSNGWKHKVLYSFTGLGDGGGPNPGVASDAAGNLYGTTLGGGDANYYGSGCGVVWEVSPSSGGGWRETVVHTFTNGADGVFPNGGVVLDAAGNIYTTSSGGGMHNDGAVIELSPSARGWRVGRIHEFTGKADGAYPNTTLVLDNLGNLYGTTVYGGAHRYYGTVFELPTPTAIGSWTLTTLHSFNGPEFVPNSLALSPHGSLFATAQIGPSSICMCGAIYELSHLSSGWKPSTEYSFAGAGGEFPWSVVFDSAGNAYGTTNAGGAYGFGVVYELTP